MGYWAVDDDTLASDNQILIEARRNVTITKGDEIVLFKRTVDDIRFHTYAVIRNTESKQFKDETSQFIAQLSDVESIKNPISLSELTYSLLKVYRFERPERHFSLHYLSLLPEDFNTILTSSIYWARTAFGIYINELRREQIVRFMQELTYSAPDVLLQSSNIEYAWKALHQFIEEEYFAAAKLLQQIRNQVEQLQRDHVIDLDYYKLGISSDEDEVSDLLHEQEKRFSKFLETTFIEGRIDLLQELSNKMEDEAQSEARFSEIFGGRVWPLRTIWS